MDIKRARCSRECHPSVRRGFLGAGICLTLARPAVGQEPALAVRGDVVSASGENVPYALVRLVPTSARRFTDERGHFVFAAVAAGVYRLEVRQVGFEPYDSSLTMSSRGATIRIVLQPLAIELAAVTVTARGRCTSPGPPDPSREPELAAIFAQVRENAERYTFLADSYPFRYRIERSFADFDAGGNVVWSSSGTIEYQSNSRARYRPGRVVDWGPGPAARWERVLKLPTLSDLADSEFHANHCFSFAGTVERSGQVFVRIEFHAAESLRFPDIEGDVDLDARSYQIRHATIVLTHPERARFGLLSASDSMTFEELHPNIVVPSRVVGTLRPRSELQTRNRVARYLEEQRLIDIRFLRPLTSAPEDK